MTVYRIADFDWYLRGDVARGKVQTPTYVPVRTTPSSEAMSILARPNGWHIMGIWTGLQQLAMRHHRRGGQFVHADGRPMTVEDIGYAIFHTDPEAFAAAFDVLVRVGWISTTDDVSGSHPGCHPGQHPDAVRDDIRTPSGITSGMPSGIASGTASGQGRKEGEERKNENTQTAGACDSGESPHGENPPSASGRYRASREARGNPHAARVVEAAPPGMRSGGADVEYAAEALAALCHEQRQHSTETATAYLVERLATYAASGEFRDKAERGMVPKLRTWLGEQRYLAPDEAWAGPKANGASGDGGDWLAGMPAHVREACGGGCGEGP